MLLRYDCIYTFCFVYSIGQNRSREKLGMHLLFLHFHFCFRMFWTEIFLPFMCVFVCKTTQLWQLLCVCVQHTLHFWTLRIKILFWNLKKFNLMNKNSIPNSQLFCAFDVCIWPNLTINLLFKRSFQVECDWETKRNVMMRNTHSQ